MIDTPIFDSVIASLGVPASRRVRIWQIAKALGGPQGMPSKFVLPFAEQFGAKSASSTIDRSHADLVAEKFSGGINRLVFTQDGTIFVANLSGDQHNNVLRRCTLPKDKFENPPLGKGNWVPADDRRSWLVLSDLGSGLVPGQYETWYEVVNLVTNRVTQVPMKSLGNCY